MRGNRKWKLIKEDIDLWKANQDFAAVPFAKGHSLFSYIINLTYLFFLGQKHCFRTLFYFRLGKWHILLSWVFRPQYKDTYIWSSNVEGGGIFFCPSLFYSIKLRAYWLWMFIFSQHYIWK